MNHPVAVLLGLICITGMLRAQTPDTTQADKKPALPPVSTPTPAPPPVSTPTPAIQSVPVAPMTTRISGIASEDRFVSNPFIDDNTDRLTPGGNFVVHLINPSVVKSIVTVYMKRDDRPDSFPLAAQIQASPGSKTVNYIVEVPYWRGHDSLGKWISRGFWHGALESHEVMIYIEYIDSAGQVIRSHPFHVAMTDPFWAWAWGLAAVLFSTITGWVFLRWNMKRKGDKWLSSLWRFPLELTVTGANRYNLSLFQVIIWTYVMIFGITFVWKITHSFLDITPQVLILLGIGGGTATASRLGSAARLREIPYRWRRMVAGDRKPRLSDIVSEGDTPSVPKFQMLIFTIIVAGIVLQDIWNQCTFPTLPDGIVMLLGVSSAIFLGNTLVQDIKPENVKARIQEVDDYLESDRNIARSSDSIPIQDDAGKYLAEDGKVRDLLDLLREYLS